MNCPSCNRNNPPESKFCLDCGSALGLECGSCGASLPPNSRFCNSCGATVAQQSQPAGEVRPPAAATAQPSSFADGRYTVSRFLGEGGKKIVYLANDTTLDREVAFALIKTDGLSRNDGLGQIFISHVWEDSPVAIPVANALEAKGYSTWYYERDSVPGPAYLAQMGDAIAQSQAVVLLISPTALGSNQMTTEVVRAHESNKPFIPLLNGISHEEFQTRAPVWRQALGASTSMPVSEEQVEEVVVRVVEGLGALGIKTSGRRTEEERSRFMREAQSMGRLGSHPHIVTVFDVGEQEGQPYMVTELMAGGDVEGMIRDAPNHLLPLEQAMTIAKETCRGLEFAHSKGIVHRDLKPSNIWLTGTSGQGIGTAKIGDFGLAAVTGGPRITQEGMMVGTVSYMPPEQAMGGEVTPRSDLYSLGAMLYEMVTGRPPFLGDDSIAIIGQHINTPPPPPPPPVAPTWHNARCPRPLEALIIRLLAKDPSERPESATDVLSALDAIDLAASGEIPAASYDEAHSLDSLAGGVFVGRQREMGELKAALEDALSGRGRLVTLVGEPGIGKTRTALELATYAGLRQAQVLWGRCYEGEGAPPYWPWVQAIRSYVRDVDPEQLRSEMGAGAADIAEVVSDVREQLPGLEAPAQMGPEQARFRLFDSITAFLKSAAQRKPLVLVLDDLHWADHPSLLLLEFVARELANARVMIIVTYRDMDLSRQHPLSRTLGELTRERLFQRLLLRGLEQEDVVRFVTLVSGLSPPPGMAEAVYRQTEGNPLFVTEVVRLLVQEGELNSDPSTGSGRAGQAEAWSVRIPEGVREVIGRRLDRLSERCCETLTIASVIGREFTLENLGPMIEDLTNDRLFEVLEEALSARVIEELPQTVGRYQFTHALIQETLNSELSTTRRVRMHAQIAEALEATYGDGAGAHAAELAHQFAEAQTVLGTGKLVRYSLLAGERALSARAYEEAAAHFQRGLEARGVALASTEPAGNEEEAALLSCLAQAQIGSLSALGGIPALTTFTRAFDYYVSVGDVDQAVEMAVNHMPLNTGATLMEKALGLVAPGSHDAGRLLSLTIVTQRSEYDRAQESVTGALAIARQGHDQGLEMRALVNAACVDISHCRFEQSRDYNLLSVGLARDVEQLFEESHALFDISHSLAALGDLDGAGQHAGAMVEVADRSGILFWRAFAREINQSLCRARGDWQSARDFADQGLALVPTDPNLLGGRALVEYEAGDFEAGKSYLDRLLAVQPGQSEVSLFFALVGASTVPVLVVPLIARVAEVPDCYEVLETAAQSIISAPAGYPGPSQGARIGLGFIAVERGDKGAAKDLYGHLIELRGTAYPQAPVGQAICVDRLLGLLAQTTAETDLAAQHFEDALAFCRKSGHRPELAWTCCDYADMLRERDNPGDKEKAVSLLDESLTISNELGMRPLMERVLSRREILKA